MLVCFCASLASITVLNFRSPELASVLQHHCGMRAVRAITLQTPLATACYIPLPCVILFARNVSSRWGTASTCTSACSPMARSRARCPLISADCCLLASFPLSPSLPSLLHLFGILLPFVHRSEVFNSCETVRAVSLVLEYFFQRVPSLRVS